MGLVNTKEMLIKAQKEGYAVPHINISNLEHFKTILDKAEELNSPIILAFTTGLINYYGLNILEGLVYGANKKYSIPFAIHLDHHKDPKDIINKLKECKYITSVMIDASLEEYSKNIELTKEVVNYCHNNNINVEAELGAMKGQEDEHNSDDEFYTNPKQAISFINETKIDSLAISIGTVHGCVTKIAPNLEFKRLVELRNLTNIPLVLHGCSGINDIQLREAINLGINKINIATEFKVYFFKGLKKYITEHPNDNDSRNYFKSANEEIANLLEHKINLFGSKNKA